ncbi:MAG TPA: hypothetical protein PKJ98_20350 [Verrucomicrobiota bacterium]|nr:hypothetical protein [Verrucomicrobiota bacterium]
MNVNDIRVDTTNFEAAMNQFIALKKLTLAEGLRLQAGLLADELVEDTPPQKGIVDGRSYGARKAGEARLARDIRRAARPLVPSEWESKSLADLIRQKKHAALQEVFRNFSSERIVPFGPPVHREARDAEGRVRRQLAQATPDYQEEAAYTRSMRQRVGLAKGGWAASLLALGRKVQAWLRPHLWAGRLVDQSSAPEPMVRLQNDTRWAGSRHAQIIVRKALARREGRMRRWIEGALAAQARKARLS